MNVKLVSVTQSLVEEKILSAEELIVYIARVSNPSNQLNSESSDKLLAYLVKNKHWSPFEMVDMTVEIITSRAIAQQILRHRSFSFQEFSQRYAEAVDIEPVQLRAQAIKNRQSSTDKVNPELFFKGVTAEEYIAYHIGESQKLYKALLEKGVAKECARMILPLTTQTRIYMKGSVRSWIHYLQIRCDEHTQLEHREIAQEIADIFRLNFPHISKGLEL
jgi:thymidylate synthase (FAD)